jgi:sialate O-acetylesterase
MRMARLLLCVRTCCLLAAVLVPPALHAADSACLRLPHVIGDHMVLQAGKPLPIWGWDAPGSAVRVRFAGQEQQTTAAGDGRWRVVLAPLSASAQPQVLTVSGSTQIIVQDVLVGEVWLCSGQSNMELPVRLLSDRPSPQDGREAEEEACPTIRLLAVPRGRSATPLADAAVSWTPCSAAALQATRFSAVGFHAARALAGAAGAGRGDRRRLWRISHPMLAAHGGAVPGPIPGRLCRPGPAALGAWPSPPVGDV